MPELGTDPAGAQNSAAGGLTLVSLSQVDMVLNKAHPQPVDVSFDDSRILSFGPQDLRAATPNGVRYAWPARLIPHLTGQTKLRIHDHVSATLLLETEVNFDSSTGRTRVVNGRGQPLAVDKSGNLSQIFSGADTSAVDHLLDVAERLINDIEAFGTTAFIGYGTLLGAVRNGQLIGHDNDVDLIWFCHRKDPVSLIRESLALERFLRDRGWTTDRPRGSFIRVKIPGHSTGSTFMDIFAAFHNGSHLYVDRYVLAEAELDQIVPTSTVGLAGRQMTAPRDPDWLLAAIYGPRYLVPDPSFRHRPPRGIHRSASAWFGNYRLGRPGWLNWLTIAHPEPPPVSALAWKAAELGGPTGTVVDVGAGHGQDALWLARRGFSTVAIDHLPHTAKSVLTAARGEGLSIDGWTFSFQNLRASIAHGARVAAFDQPESTVVMANDLIDILEPEGRVNFWLFARTALIGGGRLLASWRDAPSRHDPAQPTVGKPIHVEQHFADAQKVGLRVVSHEAADGRITAEFSAGSAGSAGSR